MTLPTRADLQDWAGKALALADQHGRIEAVAQAIFETEFPKPVGVPDSVRWSWEGDGHSEATREIYRIYARAAIAALDAFPVGA